MEKIFENALIYFYQQSGNIVLATFLFTVIIKIILSPFDYLNFVTQKKLEKINPIIKQLQQKYKDDYKKLSEETVKIYRQEKINPIFNFLNFIIQMIILIGIFSAIKNIVNNPQINFNFFIDLKKPSIPLALIVTLIQTLQLLPKKETPKWIYLFLGFIAVVLVSLPSILVLYWLFSMLIYFIETLIFKKIKPID